MALSTLLAGPGNRLTSVLVFLFYATLLSAKDIYSFVVGALTFFSLWNVSDLSGIALEKSTKPS